MEQWQGEKQASRLFRLATTPTTPTTRVSSRTWHLLSHKPLCCQPYYHSLHSFKKRLHIARRSTEDPRNMSGPSGHFENAKTKNGLLLQIAALESEIAQTQAVLLDQQEQHRRLRSQSTLYPRSINFQQK